MTLFFSMSLLKIIPYMYYYGRVAHKNVMHDVSENRSVGQKWSLCFGRSIVFN